MTHPPNSAPPPAGQQQQYQQQPAQATGNNGGSGQNQRPPRPRKPLSRLYQLAARQRKLQQEYSNYHHPPASRDDIWICEFCEYEAIFGVEPAALIRQYEEKDRKERKRIAEKRRLLEKAKMKGRKNRKAKGKNKGNNSHANNSNNAQKDQQYDQGADSLTGQAPLDQEDEFFDDEFDDEPIAQGPPPPPTPTAEPIDHGAHGPAGGGMGSQGPTRAPAPSSTRTRKA